MSRGNPREAICRGEEIVQGSAVLASPEAGFVTGASLTIDGGFAARPEHALLQQKENIMSNQTILVVRFRLQPGRGDKEVFKRHLITLFDTLAAEPAFVNATKTWITRMRS